MTEFHIALEEVHEMQQKLLDILHFTGPNRVALPVKEIIMEPIREVWHTPASHIPKRAESQLYLQKGQNFCSSTLL